MKINLDDLKEPTVSTGFNDVNIMLGGGLKKGSLAIVGARPGMGKTSFSLSLASNVAIRGGKSVLILSMQHTEKQVTSILLAQEAYINARSFGIEMPEFNSNDLLNIKKATSALEQANIQIISKSMDSESLAFAIEDENKDKPYDLIVIDDLSCLRVSPGQSIREELSRAYRSLKGIALDYGVSIVVTQGVIRQLEQRINKRPLLSELAECDSASSIADIVLLLYRDEFYNPDSNDKNTCEILVAKNKMGPIGPVKLYFEASLQKFGNIFAV